MDDLDVFPESNNIDFTGLDLSTVGSQVLDRAGVRNGMSQEAICRRLAAEEGVSTRTIAERYTRQTPRD